MTSTTTPALNEEQQNKTYKDQLDEAAIKARGPQDDKGQGGIVNTVVGKGTESSESHS